MKWEDFKEKTNPSPLKFTKTTIECPKCGAHIFRNDFTVFTSNPPKYKYECKECGWWGIK